MAFTFINGSSNAATFSTSLVVNKPTNTADWDIMIAAIHARDWVITPPAWRTKIAEELNTTTIYFYRIYYKVASSEWASYTWWWGSLRRVNIVTYRWWFNSSNPIDVVSNTRYTTSNESAQASSMTTSAINESLLFIGMITQLNSTTWTKPTIPTTWRVENVDEWWSKSWIEICSMVWSSSWATGNMIATLSNTTENKHAFAVALNPEVAVTNNWAGFFALMR